MKLSLLILMILSIPLLMRSLQAANNLDFKTVDQMTYRFFQEKKWDSVIVIGKQALRQDIDYYFLRVRLGIAYFEKSEYFHATTHLKKARQFNSEDPEVARYLCYAYLQSGRAGEAWMTGLSAPGDSLLNRMIYRGTMQEVHSEGGYTISSDRTPENLSNLMGNDSIYGEQDLYGNNIYGNLKLRLALFRKVEFTLDYNYLNFNKTRYIQYGHAEAVLDTIIDNPFSRDYFYTFPWKIHDTSFNYNVIQHEGHIGASFMIPGDIKVSTGVHLVHARYPVISQSIGDSVSDTAYYLKTDSTYHFFSYPSVTYTFSEKDTSFNNWVISLGLSRTFGNFNLGISGSWSNLNGKQQQQVGASVTFYPLGDLRLYGTTTLTGFFQENDDRLLFSQVLGAKLTRWMWGEANFYYGNYTNANIFNGSVVYNNSDIIDYRAGSSLIFLAGKHLRFSVIYQYFRKESQQYYYIKTSDPGTGEIFETMQTINNPYHTNTIIGGITWKL